MAKRTDLKKILVIGSGPIVIGQAAEFDYAGTQACLALKEEGYEVVLCNSNPATIMTDTSIADKVYMEPLTLEYVAKIVRHERPDAETFGVSHPVAKTSSIFLERDVCCLHARWLKTESVAEAAHLFCSRDGKALPVGVQGSQAARRFLRPPERRPALWTALN